MLPGGSPGAAAVLLAGNGGSRPAAHYSVLVLCCEEALVQSIRAASELVCRGGEGCPGSDPGGGGWPGGAGHSLQQPRGFWGPNRRDLCQVTYLPDSISVTVAARVVS